jgi:hypothetical protein
LLPTPTPQPQQTAPRGRRALFSASTNFKWTVETRRAAESLTRSLDFFVVVRQTPATVSNRDGPGSKSEAERKIAVKPERTAGEPATKSALLLLGKAVARRVALGRRRRRR